MQIFQTLSDESLIKALKNGAVGVLPTDTVYGLVCRAADQTAVAKLYALKDRETKPGTIIAGSLQQLIDLGLRARYIKAVESFWPNPLSVVVPCEQADLKYLHLGKGSLALRIPADLTTRQLLLRTGPLLTSSANLPGQPPADDVLEARAYFGDQPDFYVDGGNIGQKAPSTVIRMVDDSIEVLRQGAVQIDDNGRITTYDIR